MKVSAFPKPTGAFIECLANSLLSPIGRNCYASGDILRLFDPEMVGYQ